MTFIIFLVLGCGSHVQLSNVHIVKLREREGHRVDPGSHSKVIYRLQIVDYPILSLILYI